MKLPLYIGKKASVRLDDGPSLVVDAPHRATARFPLARTSQVIAYRGCGLSEAVVLACVAQQISVLWQDRSGELLAITLPVDSQNLPWESRIHTMVTRSGWQDRYHSWLAAQQRMAWRALASRCHCYQQGSLAQWFDALLHRMGIRRSLGRSLMQDWQTMTLGLLIEHWRMLQIPPQSMILPTEGLNIAQDMAACMVYSMAPEFVRHKNHWQCFKHKDSDAMHFEAIRAFEQQRSDMLYLAGAVHARFHRWLLDLESWR